VLVSCAAAGIFSACGGQGTGEPAAVAERFYEAVERGDGVGACAQLSPDAVSELMSAEESPCPRAVLELKLSGVRARGGEAYVTTARVEMDRGDRVFLDKTRAGWRVAAAGCKTQPGEEAPDDCELES
jgi:ketosteroid isomerase-like protein